MSDLWVIGDVHGALDKLRAMLLRAGLIGFSGDWAARDAHLVFLGDYMDRGPDGVGVVRFVRKLEGQSAAAGGRVTALLGNHEVMLLAATRFRRTDPQDQLGFREYWLNNGGQERDAELLDPGDYGWLAERPALALAGNWLLMHADSRLYLRLGDTLDAPALSGLKFSVSGGRILLVEHPEHLSLHRPGEAAPLRPGTYLPDTPTPLDLAPSSDR